MQLGHGFVEVHDSITPRRLWWSGRSATTGATPSQLVGSYRKVSPPAMSPWVWDGHCPAVLGSSNEAVDLAP